MDKPIFDLDTYHKIQSKLGRLMADLKAKQQGSNASIELQAKIIRQRRYQQKNINIYLQELARYCIEHNIDTSLNGIIDAGVIHVNSVLVNVIKDNWPYFISRVKSFTGK